MKSDVIFICGKNAYLIDKQIEKIVARFANKDPQIIHLDADELSPFELMETLDPASLFSMPKIIIIKRPQWVGKSPKLKRKIDDVFTVLDNYLQHDNQGQLLIITADEKNSANKIVKLLSHQGQFIECKDLSRGQLSAWIKHEFDAQNRSVKKEAIDLMINSKQDMYYLKNMIDKLCLMTATVEVDEDDIEDQLDSGEEIKIFKFTDALLRRNLMASFESYNQLLLQGESPIFFLYMIIRQFINLGKVKYYTQKGASNKEIAAMTGLMDFVVRRMADNSRRFSWAEIQSLFEKFLQADVNYKTTGKNKGVIMETLITQICTKK